MSSFVRAALSQHSSPTIFIWSLPREYDLLLLIIIIVFALVFYAIQGTVYTYTVYRVCTWNGFEYFLFTFNAIARHGVVLIWITIGFQVSATTKNIGILNVDRFTNELHILQPQSHQIQLNWACVLIVFSLFRLYGELRNTTYDVTHICILSIKIQWTNRSTRTSTAHHPNSCPFLIGKCLLHYYECCWCLPLPNTKINR